MTDSETKSLGVFLREDVFPVFTVEWKRRTWYGKLWYPLWALPFVVILCLGIPFAAIWWIGELTERGYHAATSLTPEVYKDE